MPRFIGNANFSHASVARIGVLLCNLGTPSAPTPAAIRRYLAEFLADPRVVELPRVLWLPILHGLILNLRPRRSAHAYAKIWTAEGSPLRVYSEQQQQALSLALNAQHPDKITVALAMRYGEPSITHALTELRAQHAQRILVLPLYPQYSGPSTGSVFDAVTRSLQRWRWVPEIRFINHYHEHPAYISALANSVREHWVAQGRGEKLMMSFHGLPQRFFLSGDPYYCQCQVTVRLLAEALALPQSEWQITFQSRFGRARWLEPYTSAALTHAGRQGIKTVDVICPGFAADCLETLEEIALQNAEVFRAAGGTSLRYIPALNTRADHIAMLSELVTAQISDWLDHVSTASTTTEAATRLTRAQTLGASQ